MATVFTMIIDGDLPGRFVWQDDVCVAFLSINPLTPGHTLVVPRVEVDHWLDLDEATVAHVHTVGQRIGAAINAVWRPARVATVIAGFEVPHMHLHVFAADIMADLDFAGVDLDPDPAQMDEAMANIRAGLVALGWTNGVPD